MAIKEFTVGVRHLVNIGDYENMTIEASVTLDIEDSDFHQAREDAQCALKMLLDDSFTAQKKPEWFQEIPRKKMKLNVAQSAANHLKMSK